MKPPREQIPDARSLGANERCGDLDMTSAPPAEADERDTRLAEPAEYPRIVLEAREFEGFWWLPTAPEERVAGKLSFSQADIRLDLLGGFTERVDETETAEATDDAAPTEVTIQPFDLVAFQPRILGETRNGRPMSLERCNGRSLSLSVPGFGVSTYGAWMILDGAWYEPDEEVAFDEIAVRFSDLDQWACVSGFSYKINHDEKGEALTSIEMTFTPPEEIEVALGEGATLRVEFPWTWTGPGPVTTNFRIAQAAAMRIVFNEPASIERSLTYVAQLRNFLSLAVGRPTGSPSRSYSDLY
jgi:hypothetical protein